MSEQEQNIEYFVHLFVASLGKENFYIKVDNPDEAQNLAEAISQGEFIIPGIVYKVAA